MGKTGRARTTKTVMIMMKMGRRVRERRMTVGRTRKMMMRMVRRRKAVEMRRMVLDSRPSMATLLIWRREMEIMRRLETRKRTTTLKTRRMREGGRRENWKERRKGVKQRSRKGEPVKYVQLALVSLPCGQ